MADYLSNGCEGTSGVAITNANSLGPNQFTSITRTGTGTTSTWDNTHVHSGVTAMLNSLAAVASTVYVDWSGLSISPTPVANAFVRFYVYLTAYPTVTTRISAFLGAAVLRCSLQVTTTGTIRTVNSAGSVIATTTATIPLNGWTRIEFEVSGISGTTGTVNARMFSGANLETTNPDTNGTLSNSAQSVGGTVDDIRIGQSSSVTMTTAWNIWYDDIAFSDTTTPGPLAVFVPQVPRRSTFVLVAAQIPRKRQNSDLVPAQPVAAQAPFTPYLPRYPQKVIAQFVHRDRGESPTGWPVPVQPLERMQAVRCRSKPPWPRKSVADSSVPPQVMVNPPIAWSMRRWSKPPWPRRGVIAPTGWPVTVQPPERMQSVRERVKQPIPRKGNVPAISLPSVVSQLPTQGTESVRVRLKQPYSRRAVTYTGLPVPVQPLEISISRRSVSQRRRFFRAGVTAPGVVPPPTPVVKTGVFGSVTTMRLLPYRRTGTVESAFYLAETAPSEGTSAEQRFLFVRRRLLRLDSVALTGLPVPVQPPERMQSVRRWIRPLLSRRGVTNVAIPPPVIVNPLIAWSERRWSRPPYPRRGVVAPTGLPVPVQPPERMQLAGARFVRILSVRRRTGETELRISTSIAPPAPVERRTQFRRVSGPRRSAPFIPTQPPPQYPLNPAADRRRIRFRPRRTGNAQLNSGLPVAIQPPERMQFVRRRIRPLLPRKAIVPVDAYPAIHFAQITPPINCAISVASPAVTISANNLPEVSIAISGVPEVSITVAE